MNTTSELNKKWKHFIDANGNTHKSATVNGYEYGDRLLEDVMFEITIQDSGELSIKVEDSAKDYFSQFNEEHWYSTILESIEQTREATVKVGKNSFDYVQLIELVETASTQKVTPTPIVAKKTDIADLFRKMEASKTVNPIVEETEEVVEGDTDDLKMLYFESDIFNFRIERGEEMGSPLFPADL